MMGVGINLDATQKSKIKLLSKLAYFNKIIDWLGQRKEISLNLYINEMLSIGE